MPRPSITALLLPLLFCATEAIRAQDDDDPPRAVDFDYPDLPAQVATDSDAVPKDWHVMQIARGDLDRDRAMDFAIALEYRDTVLHVRPDSSVSNAPPRILAVYRRTFAGPYALLMQSNTFILRSDEGDMASPDLTLQFDHDTLHTDFQFTRGHIDYAFVRSEGSFTCVHFVNAGVCCVDLIEITDMDLVRNKALHQRGTVDKDTFDLEEWIVVPPHPPLTMDRLSMPMRTELGPHLFL